MNLLIKFDDGIALKDVLKIINNLDIDSEFINSINIINR